MEPELGDASSIMAKLMAIHDDVLRVLEILEEDDEEAEDDDRS